MGSERGRTQDLKLRSGHKLQFRQPLLQFLQFPVIFRGSKIVPHRNSHEHHPEADTSTASPDAVHVDGETAIVGEVSSDDGHGGPVVTV